jgi:hypothetical protein
MILFNVPAAEVMANGTHPPVSSSTSLLGNVILYMAQQAPHSIHLLGVSSVSVSDIDAFLFAGVEAESNSAYTTEKCTMYAVPLVVLLCRYQYVSG